MFTLFYQTEGTFDFVPTGELDAHLLDDTVVLGRFPSAKTGWAAFNKAWSAYEEGATEKRDGLMNPYPSDGVKATAWSLGYEVSPEENSYESESEWESDVYPYADIPCEDPYTESDTEAQWEVEVRQHMDIPF